MTTIKDIYRELSVKNVTASDTGRFDPYFHHLGQAVIECVENAVREKGFCMPRIGCSLQQSLEEKMRKIVLRTLIIEMNVSFQLGELFGDTAEEMYRDFVNSCLRDGEWLEQFHKEYPLLHDYLSEVMEQAEAHFTEAVGRFFADREEINHWFFAGNPCQKIDRIEGSDGDGHRGGKTVLIFHLDNGEKLLYKPRNLAVDCGYQSLVSWVAKGIGMSYELNLNWDRGEYGWSEWVAAAGCDTMEQLSDYYRRNGILLAVSYLLGSEDIHFENLIANGQYPAIIDLEMGIGHRNFTGTGADPAGELYLDSVLRTGLLPMYVWNENGEGVNVGAINAVGGNQIPLEVAVVAQPGTVNMHIEYVRPTMQAGNNLATLGGEFIEPYQFAEEIEEGFERAYQFIKDHQKEMEKRLNALAKVPVRFLANPTQVYAMMINSSYLPKYVRDEPLRDEMLGQIGEGREKTQGNAWVIAQEIAEMRRGDVPYFWFLPGEKTLYSGNGQSCEEFFADTALAQVSRRLSNMDTVKMKQQVRLIRSSLRISGQGCREKIAETTRDGGSDEECRLRLAQRIGDLMTEEAVWSEDGKNVGWLGMMFAEVREAGYLIRPMGPYLYDGWAGVLLFMSALAKRTGKPKFVKVAERLKAQLFAHTDELSMKSGNGNQCIGAYTGEASIAYTYQLLYSLEGDSTYLEYMERQCAVLPKLFGCDQNYDVLGGNAGAILVLLNAYELTGKQSYLDWATQAGDCLISGATTYEWGLGWKNPAAGTTLTGFAHGAAGMVLALSKLSAYSKDDKYREAAWEAFQFEQHFYREEKRDWMDLRSAEKDDPLSGSSTAWCHGWGGILTAYRLAATSLKTEVKAGWEQELNIIPVKINPRNRYRRVEQSYSLCHGKFGNAALLYGMGEKELADERYMETVGELMCEPEEFRGRLGVRECENYGLMGGMAGIGLACVWEMEDVLKLLCLEV